MAEWVKVKNNTNYSINRNGEVRNDKSKRILKPFFHKEGYTFVSLCENSKKKNALVHRLLGIAFIPNPNNLREIDHKNGIRNDNSLENLRWCSRSENSLNKKKSQGTSSQYKGVSYYKKYDKWEATARLDRIKKHIGYFATEKEAAIAYNDYIILSNKQEFAILNVINNDIPLQIIEVDVNFNETVITKYVKVV